MDRQVWRLLVFLGLLTTPVFAFAHPVVTIKYRMQFRLDVSGLEGIDESWEFDRTNSAMILGLFDANHNGKIDPSEIPALKRGYFDHLEEYSYFNTIVVGGKTVTPGAAQDFSAIFSDGTLTYHFYLPIKISVRTEEREVDVTVWDPTYFTALEPRDSDSITIDRPKDITATVNAANDHFHFYHLAPDVILVKAPPFYLTMQVLKFKHSE